MAITLEGKSTVGHRFEAELVGVLTVELHFRVDLVILKYLKDASPRGIVEEGQLTQLCFVPHYQVNRVE